MKNLSKFLFTCKKYRKPEPLLAFFLSISLLVLPINALPLGAQIAAGTVRITKNSNNMLINASNKAIINYKSFNIGLKESVNFIQPSSNSIVLNRVIQANPSSILGSLKANGKIFLVNPAGIFFGKNSVINANSLVATTLNIKDSDFLNGRYIFNQVPNMEKSYIIQKGAINISDNGFVVLASPVVSSEGNIIAKSGHVVIGATDNYYLQFDPNGLVKYSYKKNSSDDKSVVMPSDYADNIVQNVINTDSLQNAVKIVKNGDKIELQGANGTAFLSGSINTDATDNANAGTIEVKAEKNAFILNHANLQSNAKNSGNGGKIDIYANDFTYSDKGASYLAKGGVISGDGGFTEVSAKQSVIFDGSNIDLSAKNGKSGRFLIDPTYLQISNNVNSNGTNLIYTADYSIEVSGGVTISSRKVSGSDQQNGQSLGDSGDISFSAPNITLDTGSVILSFADNGKRSGNINLNAVLDTTASLYTSVSTTSIKIEDATLKGGDINIMATANSQKSFGANTDNLVDKTLNFLTNSPTSPVGISDVSTEASVDISGISSIEGSKIKIQSNANSKSTVFAAFTGLGVGYGKASATAQTDIKNYVSIKSTKDIDIGSNALAENSVKVYLVNLGGGRGATADIALAYNKTETVSKTIIENGVNINSGENINISALSSKDITSLASAGAYADGTLGIGVAISDSYSNTLAKIEGNIDAANLNIEAITNNNLIKTSSNAAVGSGIGAKIFTNAANSAINTGLKAFIGNKSPSTNTKSSSEKPALSASFSYAEHQTDTEASIGGKVNTSSDTNLKALNSYPIDPANGAKGIKTSSIATIDSNDDNKKTYSVAGAVAITKLTNNVDAYVKKYAEINSKGNINILSKTYMPYEITWGQIHKATDVLDYMNSNLGIQNGFFTTWAQSNSEGSVVGVAGSVNMLRLSNNTKAYIDERAKINQSISDYGYVDILAQTDIQSMNLSGVFGLKIIGSGGGKGGVGGSYADIVYDDTTIASIKDNANVKARYLSLKADTKSKDISIAEAGANSGKFGVAGSFAYLKVDNKTYANIENAQITTDNGKDSNNHNFTTVANDESKLFNISGGIVKSKNVGIGASASLNDIYRDTVALVDSSSFTGNGDSFIEAYNSGSIDAYSLAGVVNTSGSLGDASTTKSSPNGGGKYGIGISGDASINNISDNAKAYIANSVFNNNGHVLNIYAINHSFIKSFSGSVALAGPTLKSAGFAGSYSQNSINNLAQSWIDGTILNSGGLEMDSTNTGDIEAYSASGSLQPNGIGIAGSVSINKIENTTDSHISNDTEINAADKIKILSKDSSSINGVAGSASFGGKSGIGSSFAKNDITNNTISYIDKSKISSDKAMEIISDEESVIDIIAASLGASLSGMAASVSITINSIENSVSSWIDNLYGSGINVSDNINIKATNKSSIDATAGQLNLTGGFAGLGASFLYNTIKNSANSYAKDTTVNSQKNILFEASNNELITARSIGGSGAATASIAGGVLINKINDNANTHISGSILTTPDSISVLAKQDNIIKVYAGTISGAGTLGIGGSVATNLIENNINAYIDSNSKIYAGGNEQINVYNSKEDGNSKVIRGLDILALANENIESYIANLSGGGTASVAATVSVNVLKDHIYSYILDSTVNNANSGANVNQEIGVRSVSNNDIQSYLGGLAIGGTAGIGGSSDTTTIKNQTKSYIKNSNTNSKKSLIASSDEFDRYNSVVVSGSGAGAASVAGNVIVFNTDNLNEAYIDSSTINSDGDLFVLASDNTYAGTKKDGTRNGIITGGLAGGGVAGIGGAVSVAQIKQNVLAHADNSIMNAKSKTQISSNANADILTYTAAAGLGAYVGAGGSVAINTINSASKSYTSGSMLINQNNNYRSNSQDFFINANSNSKINSTLGSLGAGFGGISGSISISTIKNTNLAQVGAGAKLYAQRDIEIKADSVKSGDSKVGAAGGGVVGVAGAVSIININHSIDSSSLDASKNTKDSTDTLTNRSAVGDRLGSSNEATNIKTSLDSETKTTVDNEFATNQPISTIRAIIGTGSEITSGGTTTVSANDEISLNELSGSIGVGVVGAGGGVSIGNINSDTRAYIDNSAILNVGNLNVFSNFEVKNTWLKSYAAAVGTVGLGAAVSILNIKDYETDAYIADNTIVNSTGHININSNSKLDSQAEAYGASVGSYAAGVVISNLTQKGKTQSYIGQNSNIKTNFLTVNANHTTSSSTLSQAAAGGIVSGSGSVSDIVAQPTVNAIVQNNSNIKSDGLTMIKSNASGKLSSEADGVNAGAISVGVSKATATWKPTIISAVGSGVTLDTGSFDQFAFENMDSSNIFITGNTISASAFSAGGSLIGGNGAISKALSDTTISSTIGSSSDITATNDIDIKAKAYSKTNSKSDGYAFGLLSVGITKSSSTNKADVSININPDTHLTSQNSNINLTAYSRDEAFANSKGGAGGLLSGGGTISDVDIVNSVNIALGQRGTLKAVNGDINIEAIGNIDAKSKTYITTAGIVTVNESESNLNINQNIKILMSEYSKMEANNIKIIAKVEKLNAISDAYSKTIAADSTSKAYSNLDAVSSTNIYLKPYASLTGYNSIKIESIQNGIYAQSSAMARIDAGVTGSLYVKAHNDLTLNSNVVTDANSKLSSNDIYVETYTPEGGSDESNNIYVNKADAKANTIVYWVLTKVDVLVKKVSKIPVIGWFVKWVWKTVKRWIKHILHSDVSSVTTGNGIYNSKITMNGDMYQIPQGLQKITVSENGAINSVGDISANIDGDNLIIHNFINRQVGKIILKSSDTVEGSGNIYVSNATPSVVIENKSDKNLIINKINTISDNNNEPNLQIFAADGKDNSALNIFSKTLSHNIDITNSGNSNIILQDDINNYAGILNIYNKQGSILATNGALLKTKILNVESAGGDIGNPAQRVEIELQKSDSTNPSITSKSFGSTYLGVKLSQFLDAQPGNNAINNGVLNQITSNGPIDILLHQAIGYWNSITTVTNPDSSSYDVVSPEQSAVKSNYYVNNMISKDNIAIKGKNGVSVVLNGNIKSGQKDVLINIDDTDPSLSTSELVQSIGANDITLKPIYQTGGHVNITLTDGTISGTGTVTLLDGYKHVSITNDTDKNLYLSTIDTNTRVNGSLNLNGATIPFGTYNNIVVNKTGYNAGDIKINNARRGQTFMEGDILNQTGPFAFVGHNNLFNPSDSLILANSISFIQSLGDIGQSMHPVNIEGLLSSNNNENAYFYAPNDLIFAQISALKSLHLKSGGGIKDFNDNGDDITTNSLEMVANRDIHADNGNILQISANNIAANSRNGAIEFINNRSTNIGTVGSTTGLHAANNINIQSSGDFTQQSGADIVSDNGNIILNSLNNMLIGYINSPKRVTLVSKTGSITKNTTAALNVQSDELLIKSIVGIGDNGVSENGIKTKINKLDAYNLSANNLVISNQGNLNAVDMDGDSYALYNGEGDIKITTTGTFAQQSKTQIESARDVSISAGNNIFASSIKAARDISLVSAQGNILGDPNIQPNLNSGRKVTLIAKKGVIGTPKNSLNIKEGTDGVDVETTHSIDNLSVYITGVTSPINFYVDPELASYDNRPISGTKIEKYLTIIFHGDSGRRISLYNLIFKPIKLNKDDEKLISSI